MEEPTFGALNAAQKKLMRTRPAPLDAPRRDKANGTNYKARGERIKKPKTHKHAPTESSSKRPVLKIRALEVSDKYKDHQDIRFDAAYGKADLEETRKNYKFLDEYREKEIGELSKFTRQKAFKNMSFGQQEAVKRDLTSLKSRLNTLKSRDMENEIVKEFKEEQLKNIREGKQSSMYYLKSSEKRKLIQTKKFERMKKKDVDRVLERKRKKTLGREFRDLEKS